MVTGSGDTTLAAAMAARLLAAAGRPGSPIGVGIPLPATPPSHHEWVDPTALDAHAGPGDNDGVGALIATIEQSTDPVTVIAIRR